MFQFNDLKRAGMSSFHPIFDCNNCDVTYINEILFLETA